MVGQVWELTLTEEDIDAIYFAGNRYSWSKALLDYGIEEGTNEITESEAWALREAFGEDEGFFTLLRPDTELYHKLIRFWEGII